MPRLTAISRFGPRKTRHVKRPQIAIEVAIFALALATRSVLAAESSEVDSSINPIEGPFSQDAHLSLGVPLRSGENFSFGVVSESPDEDIRRVTEGDAASASELNRKLTNPVSSIWSISNQFNNFELNNGHWNNNWLFNQSFRWA